MTVRETRFGTVEVLHDGGDVTVWRITKDGEEVDPELDACDRDDALVVVEGTLKLDLESRESVVVETGEVFVIPAGVPFRGYRWPRDGGRCVFVAVAPAAARFARGTTKGGPEDRPSR